MPSNDDEKVKLSFEEFQLYYESTEKVTERRLATNRWNYSICTAIFVASAALLGWATSNPNFLVVALIAVIILCILATLFCSLWIAQIRDFKMLNNAKFDVINEMSPHIAFSPGVADERVSYSPFQKEWDLLQEKQATQEVASINIIALKSSNIEYAIPTAFRYLFILAIVAITIVGTRNWGVITASSSLTLPPTATPQVTVIPQITPTP